MDFFSGIFGDPVQPAVKLIILTLILVFVLLIIFWIFRRFVGSPAIKAARGRQPRLAVTDAANLDDKRRLVLVRRDDVEHLVMIGGATDVLIESNIVRIKPVRAPLKPATLEEEIAAMPVQDDVVAHDETNQSALNDNKTPSNPNYGAQLAAGAAGVVGVAGTIAATSQQSSEPETLTETLSVEEIQPEPTPAPIMPEPAFVETAITPGQTFIENAVEPLPEEIFQEPVQAEIVDAVVTPTAPVPEVPEFAKVVLEPAPSDVDDLDTAALSNLEDALGIELSDEQLTPSVAENSPAPEQTPPIEADVASTEANNPEANQQAVAEEKPAMEDEMQKLLDELSGGKS